MTYAAQADLESRYGLEEVQRVADRDGSGSQVVTNVLRALTSASNDIDSYVGVRYTLPLNTIPDKLVDVCCTLALYYLSYDAGTLTEEKRKRYEDEVKWLTALSKGSVTLGIAEAVETTDDSVEVASTSEERLFTRTSLGGLL